MQFWKDWDKSLFRGANFILVSKELVRGQAGKFDELQLPAWDLDCRLDLLKLGYV
jgi:hypothetical protein